MAQSGQQAVTAAATSATVTGAFVLPYQVLASMSWVTAYSVSNKGLTSFIVNFSVPAPTGGGTLDWYETEAALASATPTFDSFENVLTDVLFRMDEVTDGTSDFDAAARRAVIRGYHDLLNRHAWWFNRKSPPGVILTTAPITARTITIAATGTSVAATLDATVTPSILNYKINPTGKNWFARITAHAAGSAALTLDAVPETLAAGAACTIYQDEYTIASDVGVFTECMFSQEGWRIYFWDEERLRREYIDPPNQGWPPRAFCRLTDTRIRLSTYPDAIRRIEYPYGIRQPDPSGTGGLVIPQNYRWMLADAALYFAYLLKSDKRAGTAKGDYEAAVLSLLSYHRASLMGIGDDAGGPNIRGPYRN